MRHNRIAGNIFIRLSGAARTGECDAFMSAMRVEVAGDRYYYPDVTIFCTPLADSDVVARDPCVVVEVTSPGTARIDRGEKLDAYRSILALQAYLIVDHRRRRVERHSRDAAREWGRDEIVSEGLVPVPCLDVELALDDIYERIDLPLVGEPESARYEAREYDFEVDE